MNVLFVSQCNKRALVETRRILDQFAERCGERTWQTPITQAGIDTVRKLLRQTARKNTAVACHWIRGRDHSELLWVVGDASQFNDQGAVPTDTTASNVLRAGDENAWHYLPLMMALAALAALLHDLGKATRAFQDKLKNPGLRERNHYRHEWVSVRLFQAFVGQDDDPGWLQRLAAYADADTDAQALEAAWLDHAGGRLLRDGLDEPQAKQHLPFAQLPPLAQAVAWLVFTHHRLPCMPVLQPQGVDAEDLEDTRHTHRRFGARPSFINISDLDDVLLRISADWNEPREHAEPSAVGAHWHFPHGLPVTQPAWRKQAARYARKLLELSQTAGRTVLHDPFAMHVARLCLMLADHHYSSLTDAAARAPYISQGYPLYANTRSNRYQKNSNSRLIDKRQSPIFNQALDEHLLGVQAHATLVARSLPSLTHSLPALKNHKPLKKRSADPRFAWQDKAADLATSVRARTAQQGAFIVNMASTGCGKTLGNARVMNALADTATGLRCAFAMGLRTLTLQTGRVFQNDLQLNDEQLAIQVGGAASRALFEYWEQQAEATGSASRQALLDESGTVLYEGNDQHPLLQRLTDDAKARALIAAPLLVCTVDHLTPATESLRGGRQIAPMLRLLTSDLVLDEPDDFDMADLPALTRLVHWAGLLGSRVLLSSATLPPSLVEGLFLAYRAGRAPYQRHRSERPSEPVNICCLWIDEFHQTPQDCADGATFREAHTQYVHKRVAKLQQAEVRRLAQIAPLPDTWHGMQEAERRKDFARVVLAHAWQLHQQPHNHSTDAANRKRVSLGLIRMANIAPLYDVALAMYAADALPSELHGKVRIHLCVYHSQFPLLLRSAIEQQLDTLLNRHGAKDGDDPALHRPALQALMDAHPEPHHLFIVLGSPVTEVGRDHDYDWAVVEPSSMRSLIQLAGRLRRHRPGAVGGVNMVVLDSNLRHFKDKGKAAFRKPGFEMDPQPPGSSDAAQNFYLHSHSLRQLMTRLVKDDGPWAVDAQPRIEVATAQYHPRRHWADLEHERMRDAMLQRSVTSKYTTAPERGAFLHWAHPGQLWLTGLLPQFQRFRYDPQPCDDVALLPDEEEETLQLHRVQDGEQRYEKLYAPIHQSQCHPVPIAQLASPSVSPWPQVSLMEELAALAEARGLSLERCAERYATASLPESQDGWWWDERLGFSKKT